jgi:hypothetical protein
MPQLPKTCRPSPASSTSGAVHSNEDFDQEERTRCAPGRLFVGFLKSSSHTTAYEYDALLRPIRVEDSLGTVLLSYDADNPGPHRGNPGLEGTFRSPERPTTG